MQQALVSFAVAVAVCVQPTPEPKVPRADLELRLFLHTALDRQDVSRVREVVDSLIAPFPLTATWLDCDEHAERCRHRPTDQFSLVVLVFPHHKPGRPDVCGEAAWDTSIGLPAVALYVPCARDLTDELHWRVRDPRILTLEIAHVLGVTLVHELGHVGGLSHSPQGLMKARHGVTEFLHLRSSRLSLGREEAQRLSQSIRDRRTLYARRDDQQ